MERLGQRDFDPTPPGENRYSVTVELSKLHPRRRSNSVFRESTPVEIHASEVDGGREYSILIGKPLRSDDLTTILKSSSELPYSYDMAINHFLDEEGMDLGRGLKSDLGVLGELLEAPDDTEFLKALVERLKSHEKSWTDLKEQRGFAAKLAAQFNLPSDQKPDPDILDIALRIISFMRQEPGLWTDRTRDIMQTKKETLIDRLYKFDPDKRGNVLEGEIMTYDNPIEEQKKRIKLTDGIFKEWNLAGTSWYLTGSRGKVEEGNNGESRVTIGDKMAIVNPSRNGFDIYPHSDFLLPTLTWKNENGRRKLVAPSQFQKEYMTIPVQNNPDVRFQYKIDREQLSNPIVGLIVLQYVLDFPAFKDSPPEDVPERALLKSRIAEILRSDFVANVENLAE